MFLKNVIKKLVRRVIYGELRHLDVSRPMQISLLLQYRYYRQQGMLPLRFDTVGFNSYSLTNEDGILLYIFSLVEMTDRRLVDIGCAKPRGSNSANLIVNHDFTGLLIDGSSESIEWTRDYYGTHPSTRLFPPQAVSTFVTRENVNDLLKQHGFEGEIDLLCIDIDGVDYWIWQALEVISPRVVVVEYQDILGPDRSWTVPYKPDFNAKDYPINQSSLNYVSASLGAFVKLGRERNYRLVGINRGGWNAFFVKNGLAEDVLPEIEARDCFRSEWSKQSMREGFPLVRDMEWIEV